MAHIGALAAALAAMTALAACGGGGNPGGAIDGGNNRNTPRAGIDIPVRGLTIPSSGSVPVSADTRTVGGTVGVGPAFRTESPEASDLETGTADGAFAIRSGRWRDPRGRDGTASAGEVVDFIRAFQTQEYAETGGRLVFGEVGPRKTLRIHYSARPAERELAAVSLRRINTALPWRRRILLGSDIAERRRDVRDIPRGEIHIHFTDGKADWPDLPGDVDDPGRVLGIGGVSVSENGEVLSGYAYIDRSARGADADMLDTVTHELLHAYGFVAHVDPARYPESVLAPTADPDRDQSGVYLTLDGEALLAETRIAPGTFVDGLGVSGLGPWETDAFHLLGSAGRGGAELQFGAGYRNGLSKPWAYGPRPSMRLAHNPALAGRATWTGELLGFTGSGRTVAGDARIGVDFADVGGRADFTALESWERGAHPGAPGSGTRWGDGDLGYTLALWEDGTDSGFDSAFAPGDDPGVVTGVFTGPAHEGAAGVLEHPDLSAGFGAVRPR